jgi:hypothetical protein
MTLTAKVEAMTELPCGIVSDVPMGDPEHDRLMHEFAQRINQHVDDKPDEEPSGRLRCPDCNGSEFHILVPPEHTASNDYFSYVICVKCGKLWRIRVLNIKRMSEAVQYLAKGRLEAMKP